MPLKDSLSDRFVADFQYAITASGHPDPRTIQEIVLQVAGDPEAVATQESLIPLYAFIRARLVESDLPIDLFTGDSLSLAHRRAQFEVNSPAFRKFLESGQFSFNGAIQVNASIQEQLLAETLGYISRGFESVNDKGLSITDIKQVQIYLRSKHQRGYAVFVKLQFFDGIQIRNANAEITVPVESIADPEGSNEVRPAAPVPALAEEDLPPEKELDLSSIKIEGAEKRRLLALVRDVLTADRVKPEGLDGVGGFMAQMRERLTAMTVIGTFGSPHPGFNAWDSIPSTMNDRFWNNTNFLNAMGHTTWLAQLASDPSKVDQWVGNADFIIGLKVILSDLYVKRRELERDECYDDPQWQDMRGMLNQRGLTIIQPLIAVIELLVRASEDKEAYSSALPQRYVTGLLEE